MKEAPLVEENAGASMSHSLLPTTVTTRRRCSGNKCKYTRWCAIKWTLLAILVAGACGTAYYITHEVDKSIYSTRDPPKQGCSGNSSLIMTDWYTGDRTFYGSTFKYAVSFHPTEYLTDNDGEFITFYGNMYICDEVTGSQSAPAVNCTNTFVYDARSCSLAYALGSCQDFVQHQYTDMTIQWIAFNSNADIVQIDFSTHIPGASGTMNLAHSASNHTIDCSNLDPNK
jgi:hypothetical protein